MPCSEIMTHGPAACPRSLPGTGLRTPSERTRWGSRLVQLALSALAEVGRSNDDRRDPGPGGSVLGSGSKVDHRRVLVLERGAGRQRVRNSLEPLGPPVCLRAIQRADLGGPRTRPSLPGALLRQPLAPGTGDALRERAPGQVPACSELGQDALPSRPRVHAGEHLAVPGKQVLP